MIIQPQPISRLANELSKLPGIGPKTAQRLAYHIVSLGEERVRELANAICNAKDRIRACSVCFNLTEHDPCDICTDSRHSGAIICVVRDPRDVLAISRSKGIECKYHVLQGTLSPMNGVGPDDIRVSELVGRVKNGGVEEVIIATNPDVEGEATAVYISNILKPMGVRVTRIAHGVPVGADLEYADDVTLSKALEGRRDM